MGKPYIVRFDYKEIRNIENFKITNKQAADISTSTEESDAQTNQRGQELMEVSFDSILHSGYDCKFVRAECEEWRKKLSAVSYLDFNGSLWGPILQLREVNISDVKTDWKGTWLYAKISFVFKEYDAETTAVKRDLSGIWTGQSTAQKQTRANDTGMTVEAETQTIKVGDYVNILGTKYTTGQTIPDWVKTYKHEVQQINEAQNKVLIKDIFSWVYLSEVSL